MRPTGCATSLLVTAYVILLSPASSHSILSARERFKRWSPCKGSEYTCANRQCIRVFKVCDGPKDCADGSDETPKACRDFNQTCSKMAFRCTYGACIDMELRCDNQPYCADNSDEDGCSCQPGNYRCSDGQCISYFKICDGVYNCNDGSDETSNLCRNLSCPTSSFKCRYGACLEKSVQCNQVEDCHDGSDEEGCGPTPTPPPPDTTTTTTTARSTPPTNPPASRGCLLPEQPKHGVYTDFNDCQPGDMSSMCRDVSGPLVPSSWVLKYTCNDNYYLTSSNGLSECKDGVWSSHIDCTECGVAKEKDNIEPLIIHGLSTYPGEFPWMSALYFRNGTGWSQGCGGVLVSPYMVLTAAHCLKSRDGNKVSPENLKVGLGTYLRDFYKCDNKSFISNVKDTVIHEYYFGAKTAYNFDIGLVILASTVKISEYIMPVCMDWNNTLHFEYGSIGYVAGYGRTENNTPSEVLLSAQLKTIELNTCIAKLNKSDAMFVGIKLCAEEIDMGQVAPGDSGGGMSMVKDGKHFLIGLVSTRIPTYSAISLFSDVRDYRDWLQKTKEGIEKKHNETLEPTEGGGAGQCSKES